MYWGVDSVCPADREYYWEDRAAGHTSRRGPRETAFDYVTRVWRRPAFWGRYIGRRETQMSRSEVNYLQGQGCLVLVVFNSVRRSLMRNRSDRWARLNGRQEADRAISAARRVGGIPPGVRIYADIERWRFNPHWLLGWWERMGESAYAGMGGIYGNPQVWGEDYGNAVALLPANLAHESRTVWSNRMSGRRRPAYNPHGSPDPGSFTPARPARGTDETVVWQYEGNCARGLYDKNCAIWNGVRNMWGLMQNAPLPSRRGGHGCHLP